jgi:hypothetical protein
VAAAREDDCGHGGHEGRGSDDHGNTRPPVEAAKAVRGRFHGRSIAGARGGVVTGPRRTRNDQLLFTPMLEPGAIVPDVALIGQDLEPVRMREYAARGPLLLAFYLYDWTGT